MNALLVAFSLVALATLLPAAAAEPGPCPGGGYSCEPPYPCGWAPDVRRDPVGYVEWETRCVRTIVGLVLPP
ncbi:MAG TPA: hypothetical protein VHH36_02355 [Candidatus Thermoplasmatota archaeon]|nr:hypothetical protein [Candidatus Thermoplasmatota archaeon]